MKRILSSVTLLVAASLLSFAWAAREFTPVQKLAYAEQLIANYYVDPIDTTKVVEEAIRGMLHTLDPHSTYTNAEETRELNEPLQGNFSGIGIRFQMTNDTVYVIETVVGGPSERVGLQPGDRIIACNDSVISGVGMKNSAILKILRGPKGSEAMLKVWRKGLSKPLNFSVVRDDIPIYSIDATFMANDSVGYLSISRFGSETTDEVRDAIARLQAKGMKHLIIDLSNNGGGYLRSATDVANIFLSEGDMLVYTDSPQNGRSDYRAKRNGRFRDGRLVVIVNQHSASASEILAGAIQDNDRGVIVGRRSFGKGLVQRPFPFPDGSMIRLTVSRYHTPSGRCIQKPYNGGDDEQYRRDMMNRLESGELMNADSIHLPDSLKFYTMRLGREVYGGGGIMPDHFVPIDTTYFTDFYRDLVARGTLVKFSVDYVDANREDLKKRYPTEDSFVEKFTITPDMLKEISVRAEADSVDMDQEEYKKSLPLIRTVMKGLVGRDIFEQSTYYRIVTPLTPEYRTAVEIASDPEHYTRHLTAPEGAIPGSVRQSQQPQSQAPVPADPSKVINMSFPPKK